MADGSNKISKRQENVTCTMNDVQHSQASFRSYKVHIILSTAAKRERVLSLLH